MKKAGPRCEVSGESVAEGTAVLTSGMRLELGAATVKRGIAGQSFRHKGQRQQTLQICANHWSSGKTAAVAAPQSRPSVLELDARVSMPARGG